MQVIRWLDANLEKYLTGSLMLLFSGLMMLNVIMRFVFNNSIAWVSEAVLTIFVWFVWFAISYAFKERAHIRVTAVTSLLPIKVQKWLELVVSLLIVVFFAIIFKAGVELLQHNSVVGKTSLLLRYPMQLFYLCTPVGVSLSLIRIFQNIYQDLREIKSS